VQDSESALQAVLEHIDTASNHCLFGSVPKELSAPVFAFVIVKVKENSNRLNNSTLSKLLEQCSDGASNTDFCLCRIVGSELESMLYKSLKQEAKWPNESYREAYWCSVLVRALGHAHLCSFLEALVVLDKGMVLGLPTQDRRLTGFICYVERHAAQMWQSPNRSSIRQKVPDFSESKYMETLLQVGLSRPIEHPVPERCACPSIVDFQEEYVKNSKPVVIRKVASTWDALVNWRSLSFWARSHGHRLVPVEIGSMLMGTMNEELMTLRAFISNFLLSSDSKKICWSLQDATNPDLKVAYLAQHPLLSQILSLQSDLPMSFDLCGSDGPSHVYLWMGTGVTRTPLHFDSYDNLFVQIVGAKYIRLYERRETPNLYVSQKEAFGLQGNLSEVDCERENLIKHPLALSAPYREVLLLPGDCLFIPSWTWHYVRALSTSISVNYWF